MLSNGRAGLARVCGGEVRPEEHQYKGKKNKERWTKKVISKIKHTHTNLNANSGAPEQTAPLDTVPTKSSRIETAIT